MLPVLIHIGPLYIYSFSIFIILAWVLWSFMFWKLLRDLAIEEEKIFSLMFYGTLAGCVSARFFYVLMHWSRFSETFLRIFTIWLQPGLSFIGAFIGFIVVTVYLVHVYGLRLGPILDASVKAIGISFCVGSIGSFLDGSSIGLPTDLVWGVVYAGHQEIRHPVQLYGILLVFSIFSVLVLLRRKKSAYFHRHIGIFAVWFFFLFSTALFFLEYLKDDSVYLGPLAINQWLLLVVACESIGMILVRGGGKELMRRMYGYISTRSLRKHTGPA